MTVTFEEVLKLATQLPAHDQDRLIDYLRQNRRTLPVHDRQVQSTPDTADKLVGSAPDFEMDYHEPTREELIAELEALRAAGVFDKPQSLFGKYANPNAPDLSAQELHAQLHAIATEWEQELDEFFGQND